MGWSEVSLAVQVGIILCGLKNCLKKMTSHQFLACNFSVEVKGALRPVAVLVLIVEVSLFSAVLLIVVVVVVVVVVLVAVVVVALSSLL